MSYAELEAPRLRLVALEASIARLLIGQPGAACDALGVALATGWPSAEERELFARLPADAACFGPWLLVASADALVIGSAGFTGPPGPDGTVELGFGVAAAFRNHGYASEAARALADWALTQPGVNSVMARCALANTASIRVLERAGLERCGEHNELAAFRRARTR